MHKEYYNYCPPDNHLIDLHAVLCDKINVYCDCYVVHMCMMLIQTRYCDSH